MFGFFKRRKIDPKKKLAESLGDMELPSFAAGTAQALRLIRDPTSSSEEIAEAIEGNPGVVVGVIRMVNSAAYGLQRRVDRVSHAVNLLGRSKVESLVVSLAVKGGMDKATGGVARFWHEAAARASFARTIAELLHPQAQSESFIAGLLQDMAVPLLAVARPKDYVPLVRQWRQQPEGSLTALEQDAFGWDHSEVGACIAAQWELPETLAAAIGGHHESSNEVLPAVHLVSFLNGSPHNVDVEPMVVAATELYNLPADRVIAAVDDSRAKGVELARMLG